MSISDYSEEIYDTIQHKYTELTNILHVSIYLKLHDKITKFMDTNNINSYDDIRYINEKNRMINTFKHKLKNVLKYTTIDISNIKHCDDLLLSLYEFNSNINILQNRIYIYNILSELLGQHTAKHYDDKIIDIIDYVYNHIIIVKNIIDVNRYHDHNDNRCKSEHKITNRSSLRSMLVEPIYVNKGTNSYTNISIRPDYGSSTPYNID
jgi:hypothetical protein